MMKVAIYARVSTEDQHADMQLRELRSHCQHRGWETIEFVDRESGGKIERAELSALMSQAKRRKFDAVIVWKFDRFARNTHHLLTALDTFGGLGIDFISLTEGIDTSTPLGRALFTIIGAIAEFERSLIRERVKAGVAHARATGKHIGRPKLAVDANRVAILRGQRHSWAAIARMTGLGKGTCQRAFYSLPKTLP